MFVHPRDILLIFIAGKISLTLLDLGYPIYIFIYVIYVYICQANLILHIFVTDSPSYGQLAHISQLFSRKYPKYDECFQQDLRAI